MIAGQRLIRPTDIADLAGVSPAAVANWRERQKDTFPASVGGTAARPLYDYDEVVAWLHANGKSIRDRSPGDLISSAMDTVRGVLTPEAFGHLALSLLVMSKIGYSNRAVANLLTAARGALGGSITDLLRRAAEATPDHGDLLHLPLARADLRLADVGHLLDAVESIDNQDLAGAADAVLVRLVRSQGRSGGWAGAVRSVSSQTLASLAVRTNMVDGQQHPALHAAMPQIIDLLAPAKAVDSVYDAACGISEALLTVHSATPSAKLTGREINADALLIARQRAYLLDVDSDLAMADTIAADPWPGGLADAVVTEPPFGLRRDAKLPDSDKRWQFGTPNGPASDFAWLQDAVAHTAPGGRAYVLLPAGPLFRGGLSFSIRRKMVTAGCVEAVVALPKGIVTYTSIPLFVWVLRPESDPAQSVRFIDVIDETGAVRSVDVSTTELLGEASTNLSPKLWLTDVTLDQTDHVENLREAEHRLNESLRALRAAQRAKTPAIDLAGTRVLTVGDLLKSGSVQELRRGSATPVQRDDESEAVLMPRHVRQGIPELWPKPGLPDAQAVTRAGDVLVTTQHRVYAQVDTSGGHVASNSLWILTLDEAQLRPAFVASAISGSWNEKFQMGTAITSANVRDLEIPVPPLSVQDQIVSLLEDAVFLQQNAQAAAAAAARYSEGLLNAVRYGADLSGSRTDEGRKTRPDRDAQHQHPDSQGHA